MNTDLLENYIENGETDKLMSLLKTNPALARTSLSGVSPIVLSCYYKKPEVTAVLLSFVKDMTLHEAAACGDVQRVKDQIEQKSAMINQLSDDGFSPLGTACYFGNKEIAEFLIAKGADVNCASGNGFHVYPLHSAVAGNYFDIARSLVNAGAKVNIVQQSGITPLHIAAKNGNIEMLILLLENGADNRIRMEGGKLPADLALENGHQAIASILE